MEEYLMDTIYMYTRMYMAPNIYIGQLLVKTHELQQVHDSYVPIVERRL